MNEDVPVKKLHWMNMCIKCRKGGNLLTCYDNGCPIVVHEDCLGSEAQFDGMGNFCCPFCVYKMATQEFTRAERKAVLAEKTSSKCLDGKGVGVEAFETGNVNGISDVRNQCVELEKDFHEVEGPGCIVRDKGDDVLLVNEESDVLLHRVGDSGGLNDDVDRVKVVEKQNELEGRGDERGEGKVDQQKDVDMKKRHQSKEKIQNDAVQTEAVPEHQDAGLLETHKNMEENVDVEAVKENEGRTDEVQNQEQAHKTTEIFTKFSIFNEKRKRLAWKIEEEEMLKSCDETMGPPTVAQRVESIEERLHDMEETMKEMVAKTVDMAMEAIRQSLTEVLKEGQTMATKKMAAEFEALSGWLEGRVNRGREYHETLINTMRNEQVKFQTEVKSTITGLQTTHGTLQDKAETSVN
ncbi:hypothetical protein AgCh_014262 [Apium graveolens]